MKKTILLTGATDGIGFETAKTLASQGHTLLLHGRNATKLATAKDTLSAQFPDAQLDTFVADLSNLADVVLLSNDVKARYQHLDVLINNAGVFKIPNPMTDKGYDARFVVNTLAPYLLTTKLLPVMNAESRVINLSSAAQAPVSIPALKGEQPLSDSAAYAQSKLAITMWTAALAKSLGSGSSDSQAPSLVAINPASFLGSKMVKEAYGSEGKDLSIGSDILVRAALDDEFANVAGRYFDNDIRSWSSPHPDAMNDGKNAALVNAIEEVLSKSGIQAG